MIRFQRLGLFVGFSLFFGCSNDVNTKSSISTSNDSAPTAAEVKAIEVLKAAGAVIKTNQASCATDVDLHKLTLTTDVLNVLPELSSLRVLNLSESSFSDDSLPILEHLSPHLANLDLRGCPISDKALSVIARFSELRALRLSGKNGQTNVGDDGVKALAACKALKVLALDELTFVGTDGLSALAGLAELEELYLAGTVVDDDTCRIFPGFPLLKRLRLARNQISDEGLKTLSACTTLEELDLSEDALLTDEGMSHIAKLVRLRKLNLWRVQISDEGALKLAALKSLEWLNLDNTKLSDAGLALLKDMKSLTFLHLGSTQITADGAPALFHLVSLKDLKITRTALAASDDAVAELHKHLKDTVVQTEYVESE